MRIIEATTQDLRKQFYSLRQEHFDPANTSYSYANKGSELDELSKICVAVDEDNMVMAGMRIFLANESKSIPLAEKLPFNLQEKLELLGCADLPIAELGSAVINKQHPSYSPKLVFGLLDTCSRAISSDIPNAICFSRQASDIFTKLIERFCRQNNLRFSDLGKTHSPNSLGMATEWSLIATSAIAQDKYPLQVLGGGDTCCTHCR